MQSGEHPILLAAQQFVPLSALATTSTPARRRKATRTSGTIEIDLKNGDRVRVEGCTDAGLVARIISVLRRA